jgi:hypothetical protein
MQSTVNPAPHHLGRNDPCHCGSGRKYKQCCLDKDEEAARAASATSAAAAADEAPASTPEPAPVEARPKHQTHQPWKKSAANTHGFQKVSLPRKVGGS